MKRAPLKPQPKRTRRTRAQIAEAPTWAAYCPRCQRTLGAERTWAGWCVSCLRAWSEALRRMPREEGETC